MPRLFTAIELPPAARAAVAGRQAAFARERHDPDLRLTPTSQLHLTLVFLGEIDERRVRAITEAMSLDLPLDPFDVAFGGLGLFPVRGPARVLWLGLERGAASVSRVFELVRSRLEQHGVPRENRPFVPHLTLGRCRERSRSLRPALPETGTVAEMRVTTITLYQSRLVQAGAEHTALAHARLTGAGAPVH